MSVPTSAPITGFDESEHRIRTVAVIGAGAMGRGIAQAALSAEIRVRIADADEHTARTAVDQLLKLNLSAPLVNSRDTPAVAVIQPGEALPDVDLVIEAVAEDLSVKTEVLSGYERLVRSDALLASNSSSIPMTQLAECLQQPSRFCGLHFCYPVDQRPLVEVVGADTTSDDTRRRAHSFASAIGMSPVAVRDSPGFLLNRLLVTYLNEALELLLEQTDPDQLNAVARQFGLPQGPLAQLDDFGLDVALSVGRTLYQSFPDRIGPSEMLIAMYKAERLGRKTGEGFYFDGGTRRPTLAPSVQQMIARRARSPHTTPDQLEHRLLLPMLLEATRALEESLVDSTQVVDQVLKDGLGMTDSYRGLFGWAEAVGIRRILQWLEPLQELGKRFEPTPLLLNMAAGQDSDWQSAA